MPEFVYVLCMVTSMLCAGLLLRSYRHNRGRLLMWSSLCFVGLAINNVLLLIDLVIVPGVGFTAKGHRIGRGMGFYDRFLAQAEFIGVSCGLAFEEQVVPELPTLDHDICLGMLASDLGVRRFASHCIGQK